MLDKILSVKLAGGLMAAFMALHILISYANPSGGSDGVDTDSLVKMILFFTLTLLAGSTFYMDETSARKALLAFGVGLMPIVLVFSYAWVSCGNTDDGPPLPAMFIWWALVMQSLLVGLNVGATSD